MAHSPVWSYPWLSAGFTNGGTIQAISSDDPVYLSCRIELPTVSADGGNSTQA